MFIVDAHQDIAYNALTYGRDYCRSVAQTRRLERAAALTGAGRATLGLPESILGRVALVFATLFALPAGRWQTNTDEATYTDAQGAYRIASRQADYYHRLADESERIDLILDLDDLEATLATWTADKEAHEHRQGLVLLMEGADPVIEPKQFEEWYERGVRVVGPAWGRTRYAAGTGIPGPLTDLGAQLLEVMADFNVILDLSHLAEAAYFEALDRYPGPIIASHSNPRRFHDSDRHLSDEMIRRLAERDGVMGIVLYNRFLSRTWSKGDPKRAVPFTTIIDALDHVCQVTGSAAHVGLGTDFDGGFGAESIPEGLEAVNDLWRIEGALRERGFSEEAVAAILGGNMLRKLQQALVK